MRRTVSVREGQRFGALTVIRREDVFMGGAFRRAFVVRCDCGALKTMRAFNLVDAKSCGCLRGIEHSHAAGSKSPTYSSWCAMKDRCSNPSQPGWKYYGARGIVVCERWRDSFSNFLADMGERPTGMTIDRIDPDGNYEPGNCRWATRSEQQANTRAARARAA